jgi:hypothetical protein
MRGKARTCLFFAAVALFVASPMQASVAEDAPASAGVKSQDSGSNGHEGGQQLPNESDAGSTDLHAKGANPIDTHTPIQSSPDGGRKTPGMAANFRLVPSGPRPWRPPVPGVLVRNAIGFSASEPEGVKLHTGERRDLPRGLQGWVGATHGLPNGGRFGNGNTIVAPATGNLLVHPTNVNRGTIDGTSFSRPAFGSSGIGGPAKSVVGINGTMIRPRL